MDHETYQSNESHLLSNDPSDTLSGILIPKQVKSSKEEKPDFDAVSGDNYESHSLTKVLSVPTPIDDNAEHPFPDKNNNQTFDGFEEDTPVITEDFVNLIEDDGMNAHLNQSNSETGQDLDQNTNESNNTNASPCEAIAISTETDHIVDLDAEAVERAMPKRRRRSRSRRRHSASVKQKNTSAAATRRSSRTSASRSRGRRRRTQ